MLGASGAEPALMEGIGGSEQQVASPINHGRGEQRRDGSDDCRGPVADRAEARVESPARTMSRYEDCDHGLTPKGLGGEA